MYQTNYHRPSSIDEAVALFGKGTEAKFLAGGTNLDPAKDEKSRLIVSFQEFNVKDVVDLVSSKGIFFMQRNSIRRQNRRFDSLMSNTAILIQ